MPGDPTPAHVASCVSHSPNVRPNSSLEEYMGTRTASQLEEVGGGGKGGGAGVQAVVEWVARMMGMTMIDSAMPDGGSSCDLVSPESGPNRAHRANLLDCGRVTDKSAGHGSKAAPSTGRSMVTAEVRHPTRRTRAAVVWPVSASHQAPLASSATAGRHGEPVQAAKINLAG